MYKWTNMILENCWQMNSSNILCVYLYIYIYIYRLKTSRQQRQHADVACVEAAYGDRFEPALSLITWSNSLVTERHLCFCNTTTSTQQRERIQSSCMGRSTTASSRLLINDCIIIELERLKAASEAISVHNLRLAFLLDRPRGLHSGAWAR